MFGMKPYNYQRFTSDLLAKDLAAGKLISAGPKPGERAPDFKGRTLEGDLVQLSEFEGEKNVVLIFGSATCPMTAGSIRGLNSLCEEYRGDDVEFLFVYVREAHPGDELPAHQSMEDKVAAAELLREAEEIEMPIIVDEMNGALHKKYGKLPNPTFLVDKSGRIAFRSLWSRAGHIQAALEELLERQAERGVDHAIVNSGEDTSMPFTHGALFSYRALERGGPQAMKDFREAFGLPGRAMLATSRVVEPVVLHPGKVAVGALLAGGVIAGALLAGRALRNKRLGLRSPYDIYEEEGDELTPGGEGYEAVGI
jgi:peroxiredoxin